MKNLNDILRKLIQLNTNTLEMLSLYEDTYTETILRLYLQGYHDLLTDGANNEDRKRV